MSRGSPQISVCIATAGRSEALGRCLTSLVSQRHAPPFEVLIASDPDPAVMDLFDAADLPGGVVEMTGDDGLPLASADKRNRLIERAVGGLLLFLDDDVTAAPDLLAAVDEVSRAHPDLAIFGGPNLTPPGSSRFQIVSGAVLGSFVASGPGRRRWGAHPAGPGDDASLTLCNLAFRADVMVPFPVGHVTGEETVVLNRLRKDGCGMWYDPRLGVFHDRRPTYRTFARQVYGYARGRARAIRGGVENFRIACLGPVLLVAYLVAFPALVWVNVLAWAPVVAYAAVVLAQAVKVDRSLPNRRWITAEAAALIVTVHLCYAAGVVVGFLRRAGTSDLGVPRRKAESRS